MNDKDFRKVYIVGKYQKPFIEMFCSRSGYKGTLHLEEADICLFTGGPDIDPQLYGQKMHPETRTNLDRDEEDLDAWLNSNHCLRVGVCRGAQFLNVMNGGQMWQHVDMHRSPHQIEDLQTGQKLFVTSTHHQQMIPADHAYKVALARVSCNKATDTFVWKKGQSKLKVDPHEDDWEVLWYEETNSLCFQPHPEHMGASNELKSYFFQKMYTAFQLYQRSLEKAS